MTLDTPLMPTPEPTERLTQSALARRLGVQRQAVHELLKRGILTADADGLINLQDAEAAIAKSLRADAKTVAAILGSTGRGEGGEAPGIPGYHEARAAREAAEAAMAQLRLGQMAGALVEADRVRRAVTTLAATVRSGFERLPDKLADRLAAENDAAACHALLTREIDQVLADLARGAARLEIAEPTDGRA